MRIAHTHAYVAHVCVYVYIDRVCSHTYAHAHTCESATWGVFFVHARRRHRVQTTEGKKEKKKNKCSTPAGDIGAKKNGVRDA